MQTQNPAQKFHFIAIGGAVMHNLALELLAHGNIITGSDDEIFDPAKTRLQNAGILPAEMGWFPQKIQPDLDGIILGMHARADNPELIRAKELGIKIYSFPEFIYAHSTNKTRVVIGGSHGKTTCTAMLMHVLQVCGKSFDYLVGSQLEGFDRMVKISHAPLIIIEGDEYLTSALHPVPKFHVYHPHLAMITGIAWDHINVFPTFDNYLLQFELFLNTLEPGGKVFWYQADPHLQSLMAQSQVTNAPFSEPFFTQQNGQVIVEIGGQAYPMQIFGRHNLQNAAGVANLAAELGIDAHTFWTAMQSFTGTAKRLEKMHESENLTIYRDFAHAPSKVKATVEAVREQYPDKKLVAVFEVHTYSSLRTDFLQGYHGTLAPADEAFVLFDPHVYELKKMPVPDAAVLENGFGNCKAFSNPAELKLQVMNALKNQDAVLLLMSSGNLGGLAIQDFIEN